MNMLMLEFIIIYAMLVYLVLAIPILIGLGIIIFRWRDK